MKIKWMWIASAAIALSTCSIANADPIQENFGQRPSPWPGFLAFDQFPAGFVEKKRYYSRHQYEVTLAKATERSEATVLHIIESDITISLEPKDRPPTKQFTFRGQPNRVFCHPNKQNDLRSCTLYWFNGPMQRLSLSLDNSTTDDQSSDFLIELLEGMITVPEKA
jgi:hypothetical protein